MNKGIVGIVALIFAVSVHAQARASETNTAPDLPLTKQQKKEVKGIVASAKKVGSRLSWECKPASDEMKFASHIVVLDGPPDITRKVHGVGDVAYDIRADGQYEIPKVKRTDDVIGYVAHVCGTIDGRKFSKTNEEVVSFGDGMLGVSITDSLKSGPHFPVVFKLDDNGRLIPASVDLRGNTQEKKYYHGVGREPNDSVVTYPFACRRLP